MYLQAHNMQLNTTLCDKVCLWLAAGQFFSSGILISFTNKADRHDITEILLKVVLNAITLTHNFSFFLIFFQSDMMYYILKKFWFCSITF